MSKILCGLALALVSQVSIAQSDAAKMFSFCKDALAMLNGGRLPDDRMLQAGICMGFIDGATNGIYVGAVVGAELKPGMNIEAEFKKRNVAFACLKPDATSNRDRAALYVNYYARNAKAIEALPAGSSTSIAVLTRALVESSPCK
ncbi:hypothetical protein [Roseateles sp.]|uniref:hypothetical protein n=1 Tax=Roseateles sp. TaxID=1971397 RepID=UPI003D0DA838